MNPRYEFTARYSEPILREALRAFIWRRALMEAKGWFVVAALTAVSLVYFVIRGDQSWIVGLQGATLVFIAAFFVAVWRAHFKNTIGRFRRMKEPAAGWQLRDGDFTVISDLGTSTMPWSLIIEHWELPGCWMLFLTPSQFMTLPTAGVPEEALAFLRSRIGRSAK